MHLALYRKYRPATFEEVIGQEAITETLKNQIKTNTISHAYLFTGSRGTGKTSCAKIFSRAINCQNPQNGSPCGQCEVCKGLNQVNNTDILEIDAASNNRVDEIRELRERVKYPAIVGKYKVYIIDEVHMLTDSAFNALLKTLEEPPANVVFILATTEINKLPATILSRCMKFEFNLVSTDKIAELLKKVFNDLQVKYDNESIDVISTAGDGSVRDALSIADAVLSFSQNEISIDKTLQIVGKSSTQLLLPLVKAIFTQDSKEIFLEVQNLKNSGKNISVLLKDLCTFIKNMILVKSGIKENSYLHLTDDEIQEISQFVDNYDLNQLNYAFNTLSNIELDIKNSLDPQFMLESACIKAGGIAIPTTTIPIQPKEKTETKKEKIQGNNTETKWGKVLSNMREKNMFALISACKNIYKVEEDDNELKLSLNDKTSAELLKEKERYNSLQEIIKQYFDNIDKIEIEYEESKKSADAIASDLKHLFGKNFRSE